MSAGGMRLYRGGYFGKQLKSHFYVDKVEDLPVFRQLYREAMSVPPQHHAVHADDVDKLIEAASRWDIPIILIEPDVDDDADADQPLPKNVFR